jgi:hypothetical protein
MISEGILTTSPAVTLKPLVILQCCRHPAVLTNGFTLFNLNEA